MKLRLLAATAAVGLSFLTAVPTAVAASGRPSVPRHVNATHQGATSAVVTWRAPATTNGTITGYRLRYADRCPPSYYCKYKTAVVAGSARRVVLQHLNNGASMHTEECYFIAVQAKNANGYGPAAKVTVVPGDTTSDSVCHGSGYGTGPTKP